MNTETSDLLWLDNDELQALTLKVRPSAQIKALNSMCIDHRKRPDGSIIVLRSALDQMKVRPAANEEPDMSAI